MVFWGPHRNSLWQKKFVCFGELTTTNELQPAPLDVLVYIVLSIYMAAVPRDSGGVTSSENYELFICT